MEIEFKIDRSNCIFIHKLGWFYKWKGNKSDWKFSEIFAYKKNMNESLNELIRSFKNDEL